MFEINTDGGIAVVRMMHGKVNALDGEFLRAFTAEFTELQRENVDAVVLTGNDSVFSAGADLFRVRDEGPAYVQSSLPALSDAFLTLFTFPRPVVAAVNGHAIAGGAIFACACDYRVMARGATIGLGELRVGVPFPAAALEIVRFATRPSALQELVYLAESYDGEGALARRLVDELTDPDQVLVRSIELAQRLARIPAATFRHTKAALRRDALAAIERSAAAADAEVVAIWGSDEMRARIDEFLVGMFGERARRA